MFRRDFTLWNDEEGLNSNVPIHMFPAFIFCKTNRARTPRVIEASNWRQYCCKSCEGGVFAVQSWLGVFPIVWKLSVLCFAVVLLTLLSLSFNLPDIYNPSLRIIFLTGGGTQCIYLSWCLQYIKFGILGLLHSLILTFWE